MFFKKKNHLVGLDIGSRTLKVAEVVDLKKGRCLKKFGTIDFAPGVIEDGVIKEPEAAADSIRMLFSTFNVKEKNVAISIGGYSVIVKKISVKTMSEEQLHESVHLEAEQYIPFDIGDVNLDFQILGENENDPNQINVLLVAAKKDMVNDYINLVQMAGLNPCIIDVDSFALQNIYEANYSTQNENTALVDIGASKTSLNILEGSISVFKRDVSLGCNQISQKIAAATGCTPEEAEGIKQKGGNDKVNQSDLKGIISSVVSDWCTEIRRALDFFYSTYPDEHINRIILSGGGANIAEFRELLSVESSAEVETINPFRNFEVDDRLDPARIEEMAPQAAIAMGLAIRRMDDK